MAKPMPRLAPVMRATFPAREEVAVELAVIFEAILAGMGETAIGCKGRNDAPQRLKPLCVAALTAWLKPCPDTTGRASQRRCAPRVKPTGLYGPRRAG